MGDWTRQGLNEYREWTDEWMLIALLYFTISFVAFYRYLKDIYCQSALDISDDHNPLYVR